MDLSYLILMKTSQILSILLLFLLPLFGASGVKAQDYTGTFQLETGGLTFTLSIQQDANMLLTGTLTQSDGSMHNLQGMVTEGAAAGVISVISPEGSQGTYEYRVFVERGEKYYREYLFNGYHYQKLKDF